MSKLEVMQGMQNLKSKCSVFIATSLDGDIDGGITIQHFLRAGLIDEITLTQIPVLLGEGLPLFASIGVETPLELIESRGADNGFVQSKYRVSFAPKDK